MLYFIFHAINGENGARSYILIKKQVASKTARLTQLKAEENKLERNVKLLNNKSLDLDLLEERCRIVLNYAFPNDIIINESSIYDK